MENRYQSKPAFGTRQAPSIGVRRPARLISRSGGRYETIPGSPEKTWLQVEAALSKGLRGLPGGSCLAHLLAQYGGVRNVGLPPLPVEQILAWADAFHERTGRCNLA
jgi:hypothetical protein